MKQILLLASMSCLALSLIFCKNTPGASGDALPAPRPDSLFGFKGCDRAGFRAISATEQEFTYTSYIIKVKQKDGDAGEDIKVLSRKDSSEVIQVIHESPTFFKGMARGHILLDEGTGPDGRNIVLYNVDNKTMVFRHAYVSDEVEVTPNGNVRFYSPIEETDMLKKPDCPEKAEWEKNGLRMGYGQVALYSLVNRMLTRKSEYKCVAMQ